MDYLAPEYWNKMPDGEIMAYVGPLLELRVAEQVNGGVVSYYPSINGGKAAPYPTQHAACRAVWLDASALLRRSVAAHAQLHRYINTPPTKSAA